MVKQFIYFAIVAFLLASPLAYAEELGENGVEEAWRKPIFEATSGLKDVDIDTSRVQNKNTKVEDPANSKQSTYRLTPIAVPGRLLKPSQRFKFLEIKSEKKHNNSNSAVPKPTEVGVFRSE